MSTDVMRAPLQSSANFIDVYEIQSKTLKHIQSGAIVPPRELRSPSSDESVPSRSGGDCKLSDLDPAVPSTAPPQRFEQ